MTKVDFYTGSTDKLRTACQLSNKALQKGVRTIISIQDDETTDMLDKLLWHYPPTAFIPHCRDDDAAASTYPVVLSRSVDKFPHHDLLISLHDKCVPFFSRFERVIEIVGSDAEDGRLGRERFKFYRECGYELQHIDLAKNTATRQHI